MRVDVMTILRHQIYVRFRGRHPGVKGRLYLCKLVVREGTVAQAEWKVKYTGNHTQRALVCRRRVQNASDGEFFAKCVRVFALNLVQEDCVAAVSGRSPRWRVGHLLEASK